MRLRCTVAIGFGARDSRPESGMRVMPPRAAAARDRQCLQQLLAMPIQSPIIVRRLVLA